MNAILCASSRVNGKPRQEHIAYLGAIDDVWLDEPRNDPQANLKRYEFWEKAEKRDASGYVSGQTLYVCGGLSVGAAPV